MQKIRREGGKGGKKQECVVAPSYNTNLEEEEETGRSHGLANWLASLA